VGDIERGGVFASLYGTVSLLPAEDRALIRGFVINKFRGDPSLLDPGYVMLEERTGIATLGTVPYLDLSGIPVEDALEWHETSANTNSETIIDVAIVRLPRVANVDEFQPLIAEPDVSVRWVDSSDELGEPDLIIVPGTKSTMADLEWVRRRGLDRGLQARRALGTPILGICGGFQMLGRELIDEEGVEGSGRVSGLGLLPIVTTFEPEKLTRRVTGSVAGDCALWSTSDGIRSLDGYEIHMGRTTLVRGHALSAEPFTVDGRAEGCTSDDGRVVGTYMHGLLENASLRRAMLVRLASRKGKHLGDAPRPLTPDQALDSLADSLASHLDLDAIGRMVGHPGRTAR